MPKAYQTLLCWDSCRYGEVTGVYSTTIVIRVANISSVLIATPVEQDGGHSTTWKSQIPTGSAFGEQATTAVDLAAKNQSMCGV